MKETAGSSHVNRASSHKNRGTSQSIEAQVIETVNQLSEAVGSSHKNRGTNHKNRRTSQGDIEIIHRKSETSVRNGRDKS